MKFPTVFVNHGGGPLPLLGRQPELVQHMKDIVNVHLPAVTNNTKPRAIVVISAHWERYPIGITSAASPSMVYDYGGFPPETYEYQYPAPGDPALAERIHQLLGGMGLESELDPTRGFDHGVFVPLLVMYPKADIPVVCVSLDKKNLNAETSIRLGAALEPLRDEGVLILGSGYTFHNMSAFFNPSRETVQASQDFNMWLKDVILDNNNNVNSKHDTSIGGRLDKLQGWEMVPGARASHPREEHLLPLFVVAGAAGEHSRAHIILDTTTSTKTSESAMFNNHKTHGLKLSQHATTGYLFE